MDIGGVTPGFHEGDETDIWRCPIAVYTVTGHQLTVKSVYVDEGTLCIDVAQEERK